MDLEHYLRFGLALVLVLGLIGLATWVARRFGLAGGVPARGQSRRLGVVEAAGIDAKRRLVLVRRDGAEHLLLLGPAGDIVVENNVGSKRVVFDGANELSTDALPACLTVPPSLDATELARKPLTVRTRKRS